MDFHGCCFTRNIVYIKQKIYNVDIMRGRQSLTKLHYLFNREASTIIDELKYDDIALYSVTRQDIADKMTAILLQLPNITPESTIIDCTACIGGNTISFAKQFNRVIAIENDTKRFEMLLHNISLFNFHPPHVTTICGDCVAYLEDLSRSHNSPASPSVDILFIDPPWGGSSYQTLETIQLFLNDIPLQEIIQRFLPIAKYIACKLPTNIDSTILKLPHKIYSFYKIKFVIFRQLH